MPHEKKIRSLIASAKELAGLVEDFEGFISDLTDTLDRTKETNSVIYLEKFIDRWECRTISSNDVSLGGIVYNDNYDA